MMLLFRLLAAVLVVGASAAPAFADATSDVYSAMAGFQKLHSFHMDVTTRAGHISADTVKPDRMHVVTPHGETYIIGPMMYMKLHGTWRKLPGAGANVLSIGDFARNTESTRGQYVATDLGTVVVDGAPLHAYQVKKKASGKDETKIFVDSRGRVTRIETATTVARISKFDEPMTIQPPI
ncbi:MAG TPA: hypothetical protein VIW69_18820 [Candidatus Elarobacter sp.]